MKKIILIFIAAAFLIACAQKKEEPKEEAARILRVGVMEIANETVSDYITLTGRSRASEDIMVSAEVGGKIKIFYREKGDSARAGEKIFEIEDASIKNQLEQAKVNYDWQEKNFKRIAELYEKEVISEKNYQDAEFAYKTAQKNYEQLRIVHSKHTVKSPISGIIADKFFDEAEFIQPGVPVLNILNLNVVKVEINIPERHISRFKTGASVKLNFSAVENKEYTGRINFISNKINPSNQTFLCEIIVDNDGKIKAGLLARVVLLRQEYKGAPVIPLDAVIQFEKGDGVYVLEDGYARRRYIEKEAVIDDKVVVASGVKPGEKLIIRGHRIAADNEKVEEVR